MPSAWRRCGAPRLLRESGQPEEALALLVECKDWSEVAAIAAEQADTLLEQAVTQHWRPGWNCCRRRCSANPPRCCVPRRRDRASARALRGASSKRPSPDSGAVATGLG